MKLGVMAALFAGTEIDSVLTYCAELGLDAIELAAGGYPGQPFFDPRKVLEVELRQPYWEGHDRQANRVGASLGVGSPDDLRPIGPCRRPIRVGRRGADRA